MRKQLGIVCVILGVLLLLSSLCFVVYNHLEGKKAGDISQNMLTQVKDAIDNNMQNSTCSEMPTVKIDGYDCVGILSIPALKLELPVLTKWDYSKIKKAPCVYYGSYFAKDFVIAAHNYPSHFGSLSKLSKKDKIFFTDVCGNLYQYEVVLIETLPANATHSMITSGFDLSLYTCTSGGGNRVTVRCNISSK